MTNRPMGFGILTVSDRSALNVTEDKSGPALKNLIEERSEYTKGAVVLHTSCVPDEKEMIKEVLKAWSNDVQMDVALTTGGTGFSARDVTPEATSEIIDRQAPGLCIAMAMASFKTTPYAMLSRSVCGIRKKMLILNLPGSPKGSLECFNVVAPVLQHAVALLRGSDVSAQHAVIHADLELSSKVESANIADRPRESTWPMLEVERAQDLIVTNLLPSQFETISVRSSLGRVLAKDVMSAEDIPGFPASIKDGYAVVAADGSGPRKVVGQFSAGMLPGSLVIKSGQCVRVNTGSAIPLGADAVVQVEDTKILERDPTGKEESLVEILSSPSLGQDIRKVGCDLKIGETVLGESFLLGSSELGLLSAVGVSTIPVFSIPKISVLSTGNELVDTGSALLPGQVRDSNKTTLLALLAENGFHAKDLGIAHDTPTELLRKIRAGLAESDVLITTGSVSMGDKDYMKQVLITDLNATIHFGRVNMKPGKPTTFATCQVNGRDKLVFCLPGNPVSALVTCHLFVLPALRAMSGHRQLYPTTIRAKLQEDVKLDPRPEYRRCRLNWTDSETFPIALDTGNQMSSRLSSCRQANCLLVLPGRSSSVQQLTAGTIVRGLIIARV